MKTTDRLLTRADRYSAYRDAIKDYLDTQADKGLIGQPVRSHVYTLLYYHTHLGAHIEVILPEVQRLAKNFGFWFEVEINLRKHRDGSWTRIVGDPLLLEKDAYVQVELEM